MDRIFARICAVVAAVLGLTFAVAAPASASADKCKGDAHASCVAVNGKGQHVNWIKSRVSPYSKYCLYGHSQVLINNRHYADSNRGKDKSYCGKSIFGSELTTGTWNVNRNYTRGTKICSKFWRNEGGRYTSLGTACATIG